MSASLPPRFLPAFSLSVDAVRVKCSPDDTVGDLKKLIAAQTGTDHTKIQLKKFKMVNTEEEGQKKFSGEFIWDGQTRELSGQGSGSLSAFLTVLNSQIQGTLSVREYAEHSIGEGSDVKAVSYIELLYDLEGKKRSSAWGVSSDTDITASSLKAAISATNKLEVVHQ